MIVRVWNFIYRVLFHNRQDRGIVKAGYIRDRGNIIQFRFEADEGIVEPDLYRVHFTIPACEPLHQQITSKWSVPRIKSGYTGPRGGPAKIELNKWWGYEILQKPAFKDSSLHAEVEVYHRDDQTHLVTKDTISLTWL